MGRQAGMGTTHCGASSSPVSPRCMHARCSCPAAPARSPFARWTGEALGQQLSGAKASPQLSRPGPTMPSRPHCHLPCPRPLTSTPALPSHQPLRARSGRAGPRFSQAHTGHLADPFLAFCLLVFTASFTAQGHITLQTCCLPCPAAGHQALHQLSGRQRDGGDGHLRRHDDVPRRRADLLLWAGRLHGRLPAGRGQEGGGGRAGGSVVEGGRAGGLVAGGSCVDGAGGRAGVAAERGASVAGGWEFC